MAQRRLGTLRATAVAIPLAVIAASSPASSWAQAPAQSVDTAGWYVTPIASLTELWDDNIFRRSSQREADFVTRVTPGFTVGYQSQPFTLLGNFAFDSEIFAEHPQLDGAANGKRAGLQTTYLPTRNLTLGLTSAFAETQTPSLLNTQTNVEQGRSKATQISASPTVSYRLTPLTTGSASYSYTTSSVAAGSAANGSAAAGGVVPGLTTVAHLGQLSLNRQLTPVDTGTAAYSLAVTESEGFSPITSHALTLGWSRSLTELTTVSLRAGPRYTEGAINPEVGADLSHRGKVVQLALSYFRTESTLVGNAGTVNTQGVRASLGWTPLRGLTAGVASSYARTTPEQSQNAQSLTSQDITVYAADVSLSYQLTRWLTATAAYHFTLQQQRPANLEDNIVSLRFEIAYPIRLH